MPQRTPARPRELDIDLALQGGGSHGAFTWGVLDRLLDEPRLRLAGVSGTSAGAVNAVALAAGLIDGGHAGAQHKLRKVWEAVAQAGHVPGIFSDLSHPAAALWNVWADPMRAWSQHMQDWLAPWLGQPFSPYQFNPLNINPLREVLQQHIDFDQIRRSSTLKLFIAATHVRSGQLRIFRNHEMSIDVVMASACLPQLFQAVHIDGQAYWDGGFAGNPSLLPLIEESPADDLLLVQINPKLRESVPTTITDIIHRMNEVSFNASLLKELRSLSLMKQLIEAEGRPITHYKQAMFQRIGQLRLHRIDGGGWLGELGASSKMNTRHAFLMRLHDLGRQAADRWLHQHADDLGQRNTLPLDQEGLA